jgi:hypothetical protein
MPKMSRLTAAGLLPRREFIRRLCRSVVVGIALITVSLLIGMAGYHWLGGLAWIDAFLDASMILSGMGPLSQLHSDGVKLFAGFYAIYCGIALISTAGIMMAPLIHRYLHKFHLEDDTNE